MYTRAVGWNKRLRRRTLPSDAHVAGGLGAVGVGALPGKTRGDELTGFLQAVSLEKRTLC